MSQDVPNLEIEINGEQESFSPEEISDLIGKQITINTRDDRAYLAGLAFDYMDSGGDATSAVMEFLRNSPNYDHIESEQLDLLEKVLRGQITLED